VRHRYTAADLLALPTDFRLVRVNGNKRPTAGEDWFTVDDFSPDDAAALNGSGPPAWGLKTGPCTGLLVLDLDAEGWRESFQQVTRHPITDLPPTIAWSSGKQGRSGHVFAVDPEWWPALANRRSWKNSSGETCWELRWDRCQSVILGAHPETGCYRWLSGRSPQEIPDPAVAPDWLLEALLVQEHPAAARGVPTANDAARAVAMLQHIEPAAHSSYSDWLRVGMALHHTDPGLLTDWVDWSRQMATFDEAECLAKWPSFGKEHKGRAATIATLHHLAKAGGYRERKRQEQRSAGTDARPGAPVAKDPASPPPSVVEEPTLAERIEANVDALLAATLADDANEIDAQFAELFRLGVGRDRAQERMLLLWAERHGYQLSPGGGSSSVRGRMFGKAKGKGMHQLLPGFVLDRDLHLLVADGFGGKTLASAELAAVMSARDRGFLDHQAPRADHHDDPRRTVLVIASDGDAGAFSMWESYLEEIGADDRGATIEIWAQDDDAGERPWNVSLRNLERLALRLAEGDLVLVVMDTANSILRGAGINAGVGPVETYLRLLKQIVCRHCALWITHHTNRGAKPDLKGIGGHPAFQEVPSVVHFIEKRTQADGSLMRVWHVLKLRGSDYRRFAYELRDGTLRVTEGHYFENCAEQLLVAIQSMRLAGRPATPTDLIAVTKRPASSVYNALSALRTAKLLRRKGTGYWLTPTGEAEVARMQV
jgi:hypothetical protein